MYIDRWHNFLFNSALQSRFLMDFLLQSLLTATFLNALTEATLTCLYCNDAVSPLDCDTVVKCGAHERCFVDGFVSAPGSIRYNLGCRDENQCGSSTNAGKRELTLTSVKIQEYDEVSDNVKRLLKTLNHTIPKSVTPLQSRSRGILSKRSHGLLICSECCSGNLCSSRGCGYTGYQSQRGPICFNCAQQSSTDDCSKIQICGQGEVCMLIKNRNPMSHELRYTTQCEGEKRCKGEIVRYKELAALLIGKRGKRDSLEIGDSCLVQCCTTDMCNTNCANGSTSEPISTQEPSFVQTHLTTTISPSPITVQRATTTESSCADAIPNCAAYGQTVCQSTYKAWAQQTCRAYCNLCLHTHSPSSTTCIDKLPNCIAYGASSCSGVFNAWARENCRKTCNLCTFLPPTTVTHNPAQTFQACKDKLLNCASYDKKTVCEGNYEQWAIDNCQKYCNKCTNFCIYKSKKYNQGDVWQDGCQYNCTCEDARIGFYRCQDLCPVWNNLPAGCTLEKKPGECCSQPNCGGQILTPGGIANTCFYGGKYYHEGEQWRDGCKYKCTCQNGKTGFYQCQTLCLQLQLPSSCHLGPPPAGKCCEIPVCPSNVQIHYPPGFIRE